MSSQALRRPLREIDGVPTTGDGPNPMPTRWIDTNGIRLHALEAGSPGAPLVILLHGFPEFSYAWRHQIGPLAAAGLHVLAPDQRGYALSDKPRGVASYSLDLLASDIVGLADRLGAPTFSVVGHDWGAAVAWWLAMHYRDRVAKLCVLNGTHPVVLERMLRSNLGQLARSWYMFLFQVPWLPEGVLAARSARFAARALRRTSRAGTFSDKDLGRYREAWSQPGAWTAMLNWYRAAGRRYSRVHAPVRVTMPSLILWGDQDHFLDASGAELSLALCENGRLVRFPDATHWLHLEEPARVTDALTGFLR
jgi:epoxide hydrolase 4